MLNGGVARIFQRGVSLCQGEGTHQIVRSFSPPVAGCLLKKSLQKDRGGGGYGHPRTSLCYVPDINSKAFQAR